MTKAPFGKGSVSKTTNKGGRPRTNNVTAVTGNVVAKKPVTRPSTSRDYLVSSQGEVFRVLWDGREQRLKPWWSGPYLKVYIYGVAGVGNKQGRKAVYVHRLVYDHFGKISDKYVSAKSENLRFHI